MKVRVILQGDELIAEFLPHGLRLRAIDAVELARMLISAGIAADDVHMPDWREGDTAPSVGQRIAIFSMLRRAARPEQLTESYRIARTLGIDAPWTPAMAQDVAEWIAWWEPSARIAEAMPEAEQKQLRESG